LACCHSSSSGKIEAHSCFMTGTALSRRKRATKAPTTATEPAQKQQDKEAGTHHLQRALHCQAAVLQSLLTILLCKVCKLFLFKRKPLWAYHIPKGNDKVTALHHMMATTFLRQCLETIFDSVKGGVEILRAITKPAAH